MEDGASILMAAVFILVAVAIVGAIGAIVLRLATKIVTKQEVGFGRAFATVLLAGALNSVVGFAVGLMVAAAAGPEVDAESAGAVAQLIMLPVGILLQAAVIAKMLRESYGVSLLIALMNLVIWIAIGVVVGLLVFAVVAATG